MHRDIKEIVSSQNRMLERLDKQGGDIEDERLREVFLQQALTATRITIAHGNLLLPVNYANAIKDPKAVAQQVADF